MKWNKAQEFNVKPVSTSLAHRRQTLARHTTMQETEGLTSTSSKVCAPLNWKPISGFDSTPWIALSWPKRWLTLVPPSHSWQRSQKRMVCQVRTFNKFCPSLSLRKTCIMEEKPNNTKIASCSKGDSKNDSTDENDLNKLCVSSRKQQHMESMHGKHVTKECRNSSAKFHQSQSGWLSGQTSLISSQLTSGKQMTDKVTSNRSWQPTSINRRANATTGHQEEERVTPSAEKIGTRANEGRIYQYLAS